MKKNIFVVNLKHTNNQMVVVSVNNFIDVKYFSARDYNHSLARTKTAAQLYLQKLLSQ
jgi:hypothetical protein